MSSTHKYVGLALSCSIVALTLASITSTMQTKLMSDRLSNTSRINMGTARGVVNLSGVGETEGQRVVGLPASAATVADRMKADQSHEGFGGQPGLESEAGQLKGAIVERGETVQSESLYIKDTQDSKEMGLRTDDTTPQTGTMQRGPRNDSERGEPMQANEP